MDTTVKPCDDFYQFANGHWLTTAQIPADRGSWGTGAELVERNNALIREILESASKGQSSPEGSIRRKVGNLFRSGMDSVGADAAGVKPLEREFATIAAIGSSRDLVEEIAALHCKNISAAFGFFVYMDFKNASKNIAQLYQAGLSMPNMEYYTKTDEKSEALKKKYLDHVTATFRLLGDAPVDTAREAVTVMRVETAIAKASMKPVEERDPNAVYHKLRPGELDTLAPHIPWKSYFTKLGLPGYGDVNVGQPGFIQVVDRMIDSLPLTEWKIYLRWQLTNAEASRLSSAFVNEDFQFNSAAIRGVKELSPRWKRILQETDGALGEAVGELFVE